MTKIENKIIFNLRKLIILLKNISHIFLYIQRFCSRYLKSSTIFTLKMRYLFGRWEAKILSVQRAQNANKSSIGSIRQWDWQHCLSECSVTTTTLHITPQCIRVNSSFECSTFIVPRTRSGVQWRDTVRDSAYVRARSARGQQKYAKVWEARKNRRRWAPFAVEVAGNKRRPATQYRRLATRRDSSFPGVRHVPSSSVLHSFCQHTTQNRISLNFRLAFFFNFQARMAPCSKPRIARRTKSSRWSGCDWTMMMK